MLHVIAFSKNGETMSFELSKDDRVLLNSYARECFRNTADGDYIAARALYRTRCIEQFFWYAQQSLEKYMKGILLFNKIKYKMGHDLTELYREILAIRIQGQSFEFPDWIEGLIDYFNSNGDIAIRYRQKPLNSRFKGSDLEALDATVYLIRRYCDVINEERPNKLNIKSEQIIKANMKQLSLENIARDWTQGLIVGGYLEQVMKSKGASKNPQRATLIWKNLHFGNGRVRSAQVVLPHYRLFTIPPLYRKPKSLKLLDEYIMIPKDVRRICSLLEAEENKE